ncbi:MAG: hypothetical protein IJR55_03555 [Clostridia bacterium]|nr:hypothetical protein [Clostridia bacterium]
MKMKKLVALIIASIMICTSFALTAQAADVAIEDYYTTEYTSQKAKLDMMEKLYSDGEYEMYFEKKSGEFALKYLKTGEYVFSNPYDVAVSTETTQEQREALMSQIILSYSVVETGSTNTLNSFKSAAMFENQIVFKSMKNGVRVEYAIGTVESKRLIPRQITKESFEANILSVMQKRYTDMTKDEKFIFDHLLDTYYRLIDQTDPANEPLLTSWWERYPALANNHNMIMYVLSQADNRSLKNIESLIRKYCPDYTYDQLEKDHEETMYEGDDAEPALFRMAIEYTIVDGRFRASIPAKSIRYNETNYSLESITLLPYFGCTTTKQTGNIKRTGGYIFIPDGSGTILEYYDEDGVAKDKQAQGSTVYGTDYTYDDISSSNANAEVYRMPVFGLTEFYDETVTVERSGRPATTSIVEHKRGWFAVISEGESFSTILAGLGNIAGVTGGGSSEYSYAYASFSTKQSDTVNLGSSSLGSANGLSTSVDTKYLGNYSIDYILLSDPVAADAAGVKDYYYPSYVGMANAYRDYLISNGEMKRLTASEIDSTLPLYIQSFGYVETKETFLTFPVDVKNPLTKFEDIITMSETLKENKITNLKFILSNYGNVITKAKWPSVTGGNSGFKKLVKYAQENDIQIFPDYDFANVSFLEIRSGFNLKKYAAQTMSGRYTTKRDYDPVYQVMTRFGAKNVISAAMFETLYKKFSKSFLKYNTNAISLYTIGTDLNSDFNEDNPIMREDAKFYTENFLSQVREGNENILVSGGNSYVLPYVTDIVDLSLDNSGYSISTAAVPFVGMVLHGYVNYAGTPINMAGDVKYEILKSIENGAAPYFLLSYRNTEKLKDSNLLSEYYSVNFDMWLGDVVKYYDVLNDAIGNLQGALMTDHTFVKAFKASEQTAAVLYGTYNDLSAKLASAKAEYDAATAAVDQLIKDQKDPTQAINTEVAKLSAYNTAKSEFETYAATFERKLVNNVVSVTYTTTSGAEKTFYINYNSYDVVVEDGQGGVFTVEAESFVEKSQVKVHNLAVKSIENATAFLPKTSENTAFKAAVANLAAAEADGNTNQIARYKEALDKLEAQMRKATGVIEVNGDDGKVTFINTTSNTVTVKTGEYKYITIAAQNYAVVD